MKTLISLMICLIAQTQPTSHPPEFYIDKNQCPGEYCEFGQWKTLESVTLFFDKSNKSKSVAHLNKNEIVTALTGDIHVIPGIFLLEKPFEHSEKGHIHKAGEKLYIYTYGSEGWYSFWCQGIIGGGIQPDITGKFRIGRWLREVNSTWWVKIKTKSGIIGWTDKPDSFVGRTLEDKIYEHLDGH